MSTVMRLVSVNVSPLRVVEHNGRTFSTGIFKKPVEGARRAHRLGLDGDEQGDKKVHGGVDMALYAYTVENYEYWRRELGDAPLPYGTFGENLTVDGLDESRVCIGDRFRVGSEVEVEVSVPRAPCSTLAMVMGDTTFPKRFLESRRVGFYMRVLREGAVRAGDLVLRIHEDPARVSIGDIVRLMFFDKDDHDAIRRAVRVPALTEKWRARLEGMLATPEAR